MKFKLINESFTIIDVEDDGHGGMVLPNGDPVYLTPNPGAGGHVTNDPNGKANVNPQRKYDANTHNWTQGNDSDELQRRGEKKYGGKGGKSSVKGGGGGGGNENIFQIILDMAADLQDYSVGIDPNSYTKQNTTTDPNGNQKTTTVHRRFGRPNKDIKIYPDMTSLVYALGFTVNDLKNLVPNFSGDPKPVADCVDRVWQAVDKYYTIITEASTGKIDDDTYDLAWSEMPPIVDAMKELARQTINFQGSTQQEIQELSDEFDDLVVDRLKEKAKGFQKKIMDLAPWKCPVVTDNQSGQDYIKLGDGPDAEYIEWDKYYEI